MVLEQETPFSLDFQAFPKHIGWKSTALVDYYTQVQKVMNTSVVSDALARSAVDNGNGSPAEHLGNTLRECNILSGFTLAFV